MAVYCPRCERQYPRSLLEVGRTLLCACGATIGAAPSRVDRRRDQLLLGERADRLCRMILSSDTDDVEVALERNRVRELAESLFPDRMDLYEMIYESRFDRLWQQFRSVAETDDLDSAL
ncbi:hypothetical protein HY251_13045 [bacterium]|nr:hypothetical protein [bacterium]